MSATVKTYPHLASLLGGYFHQDCYDDGDTDQDIIRDYVNSTRLDQRHGLRTEIDQFLLENSHDLLDAVDRTFSPDIQLALDDASMAQWLRAAALQVKAADS